MQTLLPTSLSTGQIVPLLLPPKYGDDLVREAFATNTHFRPFVYIAVLAVFIPVFRFVANGCTGYSTTDGKGGSRRAGMIDALKTTIR